MRRPIANTRSGPLALLLVVLALAPSVFAQGGGDAGASGPGAAGIGAKGGASPRPAPGTGEVSLNVLSFGVGGKARGGGWIGVHVEVDDSSDKVRNVVVRLKVPDVDGDATLMQRAIVTNPGAKQRVWMYARLPFFVADGGDIIDVSAHEDIETGSGDNVRHDAGRLLGATRFQPTQSQRVPPDVGMLGIVGGRNAKLDRYTDVRENAESSTALTGHEATELTTGIRVEAVPDRWMGLAQFESLVWTAAGSDDQPSGLLPAQAEAIAEWVRRGGHLVVVLPTVAQPWIGVPLAQPALADIMPMARVTRREGVDLDAYRRLLTGDPKVTMPRDAVVHSFERDPAAGPWDFLPLMAGPEGETVVVRRAVGAGMVTAIGLDVAGGKLATTKDAFDTDHFWNRVLGKRLRTFPRDQLALGAAGKKLPNGVDAPNYSYDVRAAYVDAFVRPLINNTGAAGVGLFLAFLVFLAYWVLAGPLGYFVLKQRGGVRHAWVGFVAATALFTAIAWGGANALKPQRVKGLHVTVLDGVYGQPGQRARSWLGLVLPRYGEEAVGLAPSPGVVSGVDVHDALAAWDFPRGQGSTGEASFPDNRGYVVDARRPDRFEVPARSTTKQFVADWYGALPPSWGMPRPLADAGVPVGQEIRVGRRPQGSTGREWSLEGTLVHNLPAPLENVRVLVVLRPVSLRATTDVVTPMLGYVAQLKDPWKPGEGRALDGLFPTAPSELAPMLLERYLRDPVPLVGNTDFGPEVPVAAARTPDALSFLDMLAPPPPATTNKARAAVRRTAAHGLDLSRWLNAPCVIVIGELGDEGTRPGAVECPVPLMVGSLTTDEVRPRVKGRTIVRWVYPLAPTPMKAEPAEAADAADDGSPTSSPPPPPGTATTPPPGTAPPSRPRF